MTDKVFMFFTYIKELIRFQQLPRTQRRLVVYSEGRNYWAHLSGIVHALLERTDLPVCYISSGKDDPGLALEHPRLLRFRTDESWARNWLFENIDADVMVMTMPDLHQYQVKRSRHPVHYVYVQHSAVSLHMVYRAGAFDHFDSIFCVGPHHIPEMRALEKQRKLSPKHLVECGYSRLDALIREATEYAAPEKAADAPHHVLIAPSWGPHCITETMGMEIADALLAHGFKVTLRPHPMTIKFQKEKVDAICRKHSENPRFAYEGNAAGKESLYASDIMICDWSGAALDYAFSLNKPVVFIDVPKKVNNPGYEELGIIPLEERIRSHIGVVVAPENCGEIARVIEETLAVPHDNSGIARECIYNIGHSDSVACDAIVDILNRQERKVA